MDLQAQCIPPVRDYLLVPLPEFLNVPKRFARQGILEGLNQGLVVVGIEFRPPFQARGFPNSFVSTEIFPNQCREQKAVNRRMKGLNLGMILKASADKPAFQIDIDELRSDAMGEVEPLTLSQANDFISPLPMRPVQFSHRGQLVGRSQPLAQANRFQPTSSLFHLEPATDYRCRP